MILKRYGAYLSLALILAGLTILYFGLRRPVLVMADGQATLVDTSALTAGWAVREAGFPLAAGDRLMPRASAFLGSTNVIYYYPARPVNIWLTGAAAPLDLVTAERIPANILAERGLKLFPGDRLWSDGEMIDPSRPLQTDAGAISLQVNPGAEVTVVKDGREARFSSSEATLGSALFQAGYRLDPSDLLSVPADTPLKGPIRVEVVKARPITIQVDGQDVEARTSKNEVGAALAQAGYALQGQDYAVPDEHAAIPEDGRIQVVRVREEVVLNETEIPFTRETTADPETELDQTSVIQTGQPGLKVTRERVRYEDGEEVARVKEAEWTAREPQAERVGYGTKIVAKTLQTPDGPVEYYRAVTVYATSYSPCRQGMGKCSQSTASGTPLRKGIIAVRGSWYASLAGSRIYVPDYGIGVVADTGGGIPGKYWIDLGYGEEDFVNWHQNVTIYFLTPAPANVVGILP